MGNVEVLSCADICSLQEQERLLSVGKKATGISLIPPSWRLPFIAVPVKVHSYWRHLDRNAQNKYALNIGSQLASAVRIWQDIWSEGIILRSSARDESMRDRGVLESHSLAADYDQSKISRILEEILRAAERAPDLGEVSIVVQPYVSGIRGHISNERRVSKTINQWVWAAEDVGDLRGRFNSQRSAIPRETESLDAKTKKELIKRFRAVGRWCSKLGRGPTHLEWVWAGRRLWLVQLDFEDESPDDGIDPTELIREVDSSPSPPLPAGSLLEEARLSGPLTGWSKVDNIREFLVDRELSFPRLYLIDGGKFQTSIESRGHLEAEIRNATNGRAVCRTDCKSENVEILNLPRTDSASASSVVEFMSKTLENLASQGASSNEVCFIIHKFLPAKSAAWCLAFPNQQIVRVDSLWGLPDGLQYLPHDSFEYDLKRSKMSAERLRYKPAFLQETEDGSWREVKVLRRVARHKSLKVRDLEEISRHSAAIATRLGKGVKVMWLCGIPEGIGVGRNLPWYRMNAVEEPDRRRERISPQRKRIYIRTSEDLIFLQNNLESGIVMVLEPEVSVIRSGELFLDKVVEVAISNDIPVEMHGSTLGHAFYLLERKGLTVIPADMPHHFRVRGRQIFQKLVRDAIPETIKGRGEVVRVAKIDKTESRAALLVKMMEELQELREAVSPEDVKAELADVLEVLRSLSLATGVEWSEVERIAEEKRKVRGSFEENVVLLETSWPTPEGEASRSEKEIPLASLARTRGDGKYVELTYPGLFARGASGMVELPSGEKLKIDITKSGIRLSMALDGQVGKDEQLELPLHK